MELDIKTVVKLARFTRRFTRYGNPFAYRLCRWLLHMIYPPGKRAPSCRLVMEYDEGLMNLDTASLIEYRIIFHGYYEPEIAKIIKRVVKPGNTCLDVGANIGAHTLLMAFAAGPGGRVIALEPHPQLAQRLLENVTLNHLENISVVRAALCDTDGVATLYAYGEGEFSRGCSSLRPSPDTARRIKVQTMTSPTLEEEAELASCDFIKIDVEGGEMVALTQLSELIGRHRPYLIFEYRRELWESFGSSIESALELLRQWDYRLYFERDDITSPLGDQVPERCNLICAPAPAHAR